MDRPTSLPPTLLALTLLAGATLAQDAPVRGPHKVDPRWHALVHATLVPRPGESVEDATVVLREGVVVSVEAGGAPPPGARAWDCSGLTVYAGLVEPHLPVDAPLPPSDGQGGHWQYEMVTPERSALDGPGVERSVREELRKLGFTVAAIAPRGGVVRGRGAVVSLGEPADELEAQSAEVLATDAFQEISFQPAGFRGRDSGTGGPRYPTSQMGAIALVRQTLLDADRYQRCWEVYLHDPGGLEPPQVNRAMRSLERGSNGGTPLLFDARDELQVLRAARLAEEFGRPMLVLGSGTELRRLEAIGEACLPIILPLDFPDAPDVSTQAKADGVDLRTLMTWEQAPTNPRRLVAAGMTVALTTDRLESRADFPERLRKAIEHGLDPAQALAMLTTIPARMLGLEGRVGRVAPGMLANLVVTDGPLFDKETKVRDVWVGGRRYEIEAPPGPDRSGEWEVTFERLGANEGVQGRLSIKEKKVTVHVLEAEVEAQGVELDRAHLHFQIPGKDLALDGVVACSGLFEGDVLYGSLTGPDGARASWTARRTEAVPGEETEEGEAVAEAEGAGEAVAEAEGAGEAVAEAEGAGEAVAEAEELGGPPGAGLGEGGGRRRREAEPAAEDPVPEAYGTPFGAYGLASVPEQRSVRFQGATIWTGGDTGILEDAALVIARGRVVYVGPRAGAPEADEVVDLAGKHVTPGLIDCHSHTGISGGVNEMGSRVTAEVRIADVIDPDSISFYRQLAGGLTAANQLHGSGNAIGGQNSVVKNRWGSPHPDDLRFAGAPPGIKFALGENPKRVAADTEDSAEYPQTRMGVEALIRDRLNAGRDYDAEWAAYRERSEWERRSVMPPRRDLELEALAEIVRGERLIHSHSYRQDEILMLARLAQEFGVTIGTFQHVLEGYKVAEAIEQAALGASTFSDWWAYKFEVIDAIPFNAAIMTDVGVTVSINSDSDEHARRLNTEAGKSLKYGGMDPHEALKLVTLNPAIQLGIADRVGSLAAGKDADLAIWSGNPLSYFSRCESTWVDGREYFSLERDRELRAEAERERNRILQKLMRSETSERGGRGGRRAPLEDPTDPAAARHREELEALWRAGVDPELAQPGDCGCGHLFWHEALSTSDR